MGTAEVIKYLDDNQFGKKSYRELSAKSNKSVSLLLSDKTEAYDFDDITKYIFPKYTPSSADAILIKTNLLPEVYKDNLYLDFHVNYIIVMDKVKENPVDAMEQIMDEWANIHRKDNFYEQMDKSVKYLYCESRFKKKSFYDKVEVCSVQEFEQMISLFL